MVAVARSNPLILLGLSLGVMLSCAGCLDWDTTRSDADADASPDLNAETAVADVAAEAGPVTVTATVGDGTIGSCTDEALQAAVDQLDANAIHFDCGGPAAIVVTTEKVLSRDVVIDGGGLITLSGGEASRIFHIEGDLNGSAPHVQLENLNIIDGSTASLPGTPLASGGAIFRNGGSLTVVDTVFTNNACPAVGKDVAGGAIYALGEGATVIVDSIFTSNTCSNGGAVGVFNGSLTISGTNLVGNEATGVGGNLEEGGAGGAIYMDGTETLLIETTEITNNTAAEIGGGLWRISQPGIGPTTIDRTVIAYNAVTGTTLGIGGGAYLQGLQTEITATTIAHNTSENFTGIMVSDHPGQTTITMTNVTIAHNVAASGLGGGLMIGSDIPGTLINVTVAYNQTEGEGSFAPGFAFGGSTTVRNSLFAENSKVFLWDSSNCNQSHPGDSNVQWPEVNEGGSSELACTEDALFLDPALGPLEASNGGLPTILPQAEGLNIGTDCPATDQHGNPRPEQGCTVGAVQIAP